MPARVRSTRFDLDRLASSPVREGPQLGLVPLPSRELEQPRKSQKVLAIGVVAEGAIDLKDNGQFCGFWRQFGRSNKKGSSGGRWGLGKLVFSSSSSIKT